MHSDQYAITTDLVRQLVDEQFPQWHSLPLSTVPSTGTVSALFRLGEALLVRLPLQPGVTEAELRGEHDTLTKMSAMLSPWAVPSPVAIGTPSAGFPSPWAVVNWLPGSPARYGNDDIELAAELAEVVRRLQAMPVAGRTRRGPGRGGRFADVDESVRTWIAQDAATIARTPGVDDAALISLWDRVLDLPTPGGWRCQHGDLMPGNLLLTDAGRLSAVIDWSSFDVGDPAYDLMPAWNLFTGAAREVFLAESGADSEAVLRSRGWALAQAVGCLGYYESTNPAMSRLAADTLRAVLSAG